MLRPQKHEESVQMLLPNLTSGFRRCCSVAFISPSAGSSSLPDAGARTPVLLFNPSCHHAAETASELLKAHFYVEGLNPVPSKHLDDTQYFLVHYLLTGFTEYCSQVISLYLLVPLQVVLGRNGSCQDMLQSNICKNTSKLNEEFAKSCRTFQPMSHLKALARSEICS